MDAVALALLAGLLFAVAAGVQQSAARALLAARPSAGGRVVACLPITGALTGLFRHRMWLAGWGVNAVGFVIQAVALHRGSVGLVQPVLVTQLLFTIPVAVIGTGRRPAPTDWLAGLSVCLGIVVFVSTWGTGTLHVGPDRSRVLLAVLGSWALAILLVVAAGARRSRVRAGLASVAAGLCFASSAVLMKATIDPLVRDGVGEALSDWPAYLLFVSTTLGLVIGQDALAAGSLPTAVAGMTITNPLASAAIGVLAFHESVPMHASTIAGLAFSAVLLTGGALVLAVSPTLRAPRPASEPAISSSSSTHSGVYVPDRAGGTAATTVTHATMVAMVPTEQART